MVWCGMVWGCGWGSEGLGTYIVACGEHTYRDTHLFFIFLACFPFSVF